METALRSTNMNLEDAIELLNQGRLNVESWRRPEDHSPFDLASSHPGAGFPTQRFSQVSQQLTFPPVSLYICDHCFLFGVCLLIRLEIREKCNTYLIHVFRHERSIENS